MAASRAIKIVSRLPALLLMAGVVTCAPFLVSAQQPSGPPGGGSVPQPPGQAPQNPDTVGTNPEQSDMQKMADQAFIRNTMEKDQTQIDLSQLAEQKSSSPDVKQFSHQMLKVDAALQSQFEPAAKQMGVYEPKGPSKKEKKEIDAMQALSGQQFDSAYIEAMAREQGQSLKLFRDETTNTQNKALLTVVQADTPVLAQNLETLKKIAQAHNVEIDAKGKQ